MYVYEIEVPKWTSIDSPITELCPNKVFIYSIQLQSFQLKSINLGCLWLYLILQVKNDRHIESCQFIRMLRCVCEPHSHILIYWNSVVYCSKIWVRYSGYVHVRFGGAPFQTRIIIMIPESGEKLTRLTLDTFKTEKAKTNLKFFVPILSFFEVKNCAVIFSPVLNLKDSGMNRQIEANFIHQCPPKLDIQYKIKVYWLSEYCQTVY